MHCFGVAVLRVLNQKHHQKSDDGRSRVDDQLPRIGKMKSGAGDEPHEDDTYSSSECPGAAEHRRGTPGENTERVADYAKEIAFLLVLS